MLLIELMMNREKRKETANSWWIAVSKGEKWDIDGVKTVHKNRNETTQKDGEEEEVLGEEVEWTSVKDVPRGERK